MCEEGWCVGLGQEGGCQCESQATPLNTLKRGGIEEGTGNKNFKMGGKLVKQWVS